MPSNNAYAGWIGFAGLLMIVMGAIDFFEGLIAIIRGGYFYGLTSSNQIIIFDSKTWGWLTLLWGILVLLAGFGLVGGAGWARWFSIIAVAISILHQLAFVGSAAYPLWSLAVLALSIIILYALTVHWGDREKMAV
ncbi:MAG TPA: hypothetical protein VHS03_13255 [Gaiellaceae bacterium]|nr:hypothetical protein [Gaiellaceae bacterium]